MNGGRGDHVLRLGPWLARLPEIVRDVSARWALSFAAPLPTSEATCAWIVPVRRADGTDAVLKVALPHFEGLHEIAGLRFWAADATVRLLEADEGSNAMLLERCDPGTSLRSMPEPDQDRVIAALLRRLWRRPPSDHPFRPLSTMLQLWTEESHTDTGRHGSRDPGLARTALSVLDDLSRPTTADALLATDLHAGNVLRAEREPWLVIDPKPFVGDPAYDGTQHILNGLARFAADPVLSVRRFADLLGVSPERLRLWTFARAALHADDSFGDTQTLARALAP